MFTREFRYLENEKIDFVCNYFYDQQGNITEAKTVKQDSSLVADIKKKYDSNNLIVEQYCYEEAGGTFLYHNVFQYDSLKRLVDCHWYWPTGLRVVEKYFYDGMKKKESVNYDPDGKFLFRWVYKYDGQGNIIESTQYYPDSVIKGQIVCLFDKDNNMIKKTNLFEKNVQQSSSYEFDKRGFMINKTEYSPSGKITAKFRYRYEYY